MDFQICRDIATGLPMLFSHSVKLRAFPLADTVSLHYMPIFCVRQSHAVKRLLPLFEANL